MPQERIYLDHNATSPLRPEAHDAMLEAMALDGNPSSVHAEGRAAKAVLERARKQVASLVGAEPEQVVFTSGGTEANAMVFRPWFFDERWDDLGDFAGPVAFVAEFEHPSVLDGLNASSLAFFYEERLPISDDGVVGVGQAVKAIDDVLAKTQVMTDTGETDPTPHRSFAATLMMANNETGVIQPAVEFAEHVRDRPGWFHCDAVQAIGKVSVDFATSSFATMSASSHKLGGPKGVGALVFRGNDVLVDEPMMRGGGQEKRMR
ncbi:MAG: cysteine desulfurase family protein, partial [Hyphomicrobiaceae bacterium]